MAFYIVSLEKDSLALTKLMSGQVLQTRRRPKMIFAVLKQTFFSTICYLISFISRSVSHFIIIYIEFFSFAHLL